MSNAIYSDLGAQYEIFAGVTKTFTSVIIDPSTGQAQDMTNTSVYATGTVDIKEADGTVIQSGVAITYVVRTAGSSYVTWTVGPFTNLQAGNWKAYLNIINQSSIVIDTQEYNFKIKES